MATPKLLILFGSQTGNSQDVAERIGREARRRHFEPCTLAMNAYSVQSLPSEQFVFFVASTTGQGEPPSNMSRFWRFLLRKSLPADSLNGVRYAVFGLGDSGYVNYNVVAKKLDRRLAALGARELLPRGLGDDQHPLGYDASLDPWLQDCWAQLRLLHPLPPDLRDPSPSETAALDVPRYRVMLLPGAGGGFGGRSDVERCAEAVAAAHAFDRLEAAAAGINAEAERPTGSQPGNPCMATLVTNQRITAVDHFQDTRHMEFDLGEDGPIYEPGDVLSIFPRQDENAVKSLLARMGLDPEARVRIELREAPAGGPGGLSMEAGLHAFVQGALDIHSASPRRYFFQVLQHFAREELQRERLQHFASTEGREDLALYNQSEGRAVSEVLTDFSSVALPLEWLVQVCPRLQPRQFSIASSISAHPRQAHITLAVVDYRTPFKRRKRGLCSSWLASLSKGAQVPVWIEKGVLRLPEDPRVPLIMIGPGTGVAPFRAFLEELSIRKAAGVGVAPSYLYFGCRGAEKDFYYREQFQQLQREGVLAERGGLLCACSRDQPGKFYVTHLLALNAPQLLDLLLKGASVFVCGSAAKMPQEVASVFREKVLQGQAGMSAAEAHQRLRQLELAGKYTVEAWG